MILVPRVFNWEIVAQVEALRLTAIGGRLGCGIGTIYSATGGWHINIEDCTVIAQANEDEPAGIGSRGGAWCGDITIKNEETGQEYHGFENHNGKTYLGKGERPLGKVVSGHGNNGEDGSEGAIYKNVYCSYFHGPILTRNGEIAKKILLAALHHKYPAADLSQAAALEIKPTF